MKVLGRTKSLQFFCSLILFIGFLIIFEGIAVYVINLKSPYWADEVHFVETIRQFGKEINLNLIRHYNEMSTPLPFILYALWGRIFGFEVHILRYFSMIIAFITYILFY
ncbi:MAG: hypothetical protein OEZ20_02865 [candidate division WOR-3 bacterium]|nr:hypothetical protein [candidate division WOR-3 bacterium]